MVRADPHRSDLRLGPDRPAFTGTCGQILGDLDRLRSIGAAEIILDLHATGRSVDELLDIGLTLSQPAITVAAKTPLGRDDGEHAGLAVPIDAASVVGRLVRRGGSLDRPERDVGRLDEA